MQKHAINTENWSLYKIGTLFQSNKKRIPSGCDITKANLKKGTVQRISNSSKNNGILGYFADKGDNTKYKVFNNFISVTALGSVFYHMNEASVAGGVYVLKPIQDLKLTEKQMLALVTLIEVKLKTYSLNFCNRLNSCKLYDVEIPLPIKNGTTGSSIEDIDWDDLEKLMTKIYVQASERIESINIKAKSGHIT